MTAFLVTAAGYTCCLTLGAAGVAHARHVRAFEYVLRRQRLLPVALLGVLAPTVVAVELALAGAGLLVLGARDLGPGRALVLLAVALLYAGYAAYSWVLVARGSEAPCGCTGSDHAVDRTVVARAAGLSVTALAAAVGAGSILAPAADAEFVIAATASLALTVILWVLPAALQDPGAGRASAFAPFRPSLPRGGR